MRLPPPWVPPPLGEIFILGAPFSAPGGKVSPRGWGQAPGPRDPTCPHVGVRAAPPVTDAALCSLWEPGRDSCRGKARPGCKQPSYFCAPKASGALHGRGAEIQQRCGEPKARPGDVCVPRVLQEQSAPAASEQGRGAPGAVPSSLVVSAECFLANSPGATARPLVINVARRN